jgi:hypothetical protein
MKISLWHPLSREMLIEDGHSHACADNTRMQSLMLADLSHLALGEQPDPAWHAEWAALLTRRVRATEG